MMAMQARLLLRDHSAKMVTIPGGTQMRFFGLWPERSG